MYRWCRVKAPWAGQKMLLTRPESLPPLQPALLVALQVRHAPLQVQGHLHLCTSANGGWRQSSGHTRPLPSPSPYAQNPSLEGPHWLDSHSLTMSASAQATGPARVRCALFIHVGTKLAFSAYGISRLLLRHVTQIC